MGLNASINDSVLIDHRLDVTSDTFLLLTYLSCHSGLYLLEKQA